jgi:hypothetical protein
MQAALPQDGAPHARQGREQINERQRRQDAGLPPLHGSGLQVRVEEDRAPHAHALVAERRDKTNAVKQRAVAKIDFTLVLLGRNRNSTSKTRETPGNFSERELQTFFYSSSSSS